MYSILNCRIYGKFSEQTSNVEHNQMAQCAIKGNVVQKILDLHLVYAVENRIVYR